MMKYYIIHIGVYHKNKILFSNGRECITQQFDGDEDKTKIIELDWENINAIHKEYEKYDGLNIEQSKKGRIIRLKYDDSFFKFKIKEWKNKNLNLRLELKRIEIENPSINTILKYGNGDVALQYLKERL